MQTGNEHDHEVGFGAPVRGIVCERDSLAYEFVVARDGLEEDEQAGVRAEQNEEGKKFKRTVIVVSAIDAAHALAHKNSKADISPVIGALKKIVDADADTLKKAQISKRVVIDAKQAINLLSAEK